MPPAYAIDAKELVRSFGDVKALNQLSFRVPAGVIFGLLGPNGSGKTTTMRILLGLLTPSAGTAQVLGFSVSTESDRIREYTGVLLENHGLDERLSAADNLDFWGRIWHMDAMQRAQRKEELLRGIGLWERRFDRVAGWSHGMKRRLALARAVLPSPRLLLLDEPTTGLDVASAVALRKDLAALTASAGTTVILSTHNMTEAEELCESVAVIRAGRLAAQGSPRQLRDQAERPHIEILGRGLSPETAKLMEAQPHVVSAIIRDGRLRIESSKVIDPAPLVALLVSSGVAIEEVARSAPTLEEVFLQLTEEARSHAQEASD